MILVILLLVAASIGYGVFYLARLDSDNYVKVYVADYLIETNLLGFLTLLLIAVAAFYFMIWLVRFIWRTPGVISRWNKRHKQNVAEEQLGAGYLSMIKGDWRRAEAQLVRRSEDSPIAYINYLGAAQAAQEQGKHSERDQYLLQALKVAPKERLAVGLSKARLHQKAGQWDQARETLLDLAKEGHSNPQYSAMLLQTYEAEKDWDNARKVLSQASHYKALPEAHLERIQLKVHVHNLSAAEDLKRAWKEVPRAQRTRIDLVEYYVGKLMASGDHLEAEKVIRGTHKKDWSNQLAEWYGRLKTDRPEKQLRQVESWLLARPESVVLRIAAARLAIAADQPEGAKSHLKEAISARQLPEAYALLGQVMELQEEYSEALKLYRSGLSTLVNSMSDAPSSMVQLADP